MEKLLIIDDSEEIRTQLKWGFGKQYSVLLAGDGIEGLALFRKHEPRVVALDLGLPPCQEGTEQGFRCLKEILLHDPPPKVIVITGNDDRENALRAVQMGAYDFYQKPIVLDEFTVIVERAFHLWAIEEDNRRLQSAIASQVPEFGDMIGNCPQMQDVFSTIRKVATSDVAVLVQGESGTGKELVARAIHSLSLRKDGSFVPINCGAIPENLLESELFGHEKGAFTGAHAQVQGKVEYAQQGTLFLDEIGELPAPLQVKLLRFLQEKTVQRVGGRQTIEVDARIIVASNKDLSVEIEEGRFREDLFYRIGVVIITLPPLRERKDDIMLLATLFLRRSSDNMKKRIKGFSGASLALLESYLWPGNVRELENRIQRAVILSESAIIVPADLGFNERTQNEQHQVKGVTLREARERLEREMVVSAVDKHHGSISHAAEELGISRPTLYDILKKHGLYAGPHHSAR